MPLPDQLVFATSKLPSQIGKGAARFEVECSKMRSSWCGTVGVVFVQDKPSGLKQYLFRAPSSPSRILDSSAVLA